MFQCKIVQRPSFEINAADCFVMETEFWDPTSKVDLEVYLLRLHISSPPWTMEYGHRVAIETGETKTPMLDFEQKSKEGSLYDKLEKYLFIPSINQVLWVLYLSFSA
ncbi:uncharacterized protein LOC111289542 isoform X2 [Durio zibethinus]|uniref:Uncharacterized protein LOC111289542 isoform X2 n=1 Tax=Durio zibethinus TaxID=66656 RepID=A0A6P5Y7I8_DURZI|nr:uncharacterized protein LOC111289542 isoform X2 [Durio zibethinus]